MLREGTLQSEAWPGAELGRAAFLLVAEPGGFHSQRQSISFANTAFADEGEKMREMSKLQKPFLSEDCEAKHGSPVLSYAVPAGLWGFSEFLLETNSVWQFDTICDMWHDWHVNASQTELILEARSPQSLQTRQAFQGFKRYRQDRLAKASANHIARTLVAPVRLCGLRTQMSDWTQMCYWDSWDFYFSRATVLNWPQLAWETDMDIMSQELQTKEADHTRPGFLAQSCAAKADIDKRISDTNGLLSSTVRWLSWWKQYVQDVHRAQLNTTHWALCSLCQPFTGHWRCFVLFFGFVSCCIMSCLMFCILWKLVKSMSGNKLPSNGVHCTNGHGCSSCRNSWRVGTAGRLSARSTWGLERLIWSEKDLRGHGWSTPWYSLIVLDTPWVVLRCAPLSSRPLHKVDMVLFFQTLIFWIWRWHVFGYS